jgi:hypothetical protein
VDVILSLPFKGHYPVTQTYQEHKDWAYTNGYCWKPFVGCTKWYYPGWDFGTPLGTELLASLGGKATLAKEKTGYGWSIKIDDGFGNKIVYGHLSKFLVAQGQVVRQGDIIGLSGGVLGAIGSGNSSGAHVHWEYRINTIPTDPTPFIGAQPASVLLVGDGISITGFPRIRTVPYLSDANIVGSAVPSNAVMYIRELLIVDNILWGRFNDLWIALQQGEERYYKKGA